MVKFVELVGKALCVCHATLAEKDVIILSLIDWPKSHQPFGCQVYILSWANGLHSAALKARDGWAIHNDPDSMKTSDVLHP